MTNSSRQHPPPRGFFVTGTDTGVGKTVVAATLLVALRADGVDAAPMKPVQTGCRDHDGRRQAPDLDFALAMAGLDASDDERSLMLPYAFTEPCSPHLAAELEGENVQLPKIQEAFQQLAERRSCVVVEGAGGILVPLNRYTTMLDLMVALGLPVILVARAGLGTINHTLLSVYRLREANLAIAGIVINDDRDESDGTDLTSRRIADDNIGAIEQFAGVPILARLPHVPSLDTENPGARESLQPCLAAFPPTKELLTPNS